MKKLLAALLLTVAVSQAKAQIFWTENFSGGSTGLQVGSYTSTNGAWSNNTLSTEGASPNIWYVSCTEAGKTVGTCGAPCATGDFGSSLHLGSNSVVGGDVGAAYFTGGCFTYTSYYGYTYTYGTCAATDRRAESPVINCTGKSAIKLSYYYIENGDVSTDNGTVWYHNGTSWSLLEDPTKTTVCASTQGTWAKRTVSLPASADNNPNVKIGFRWVNDEDGVGADPSFAVDSVSLSSSAPVASFTTTATSACQDSCITFTSTSTGTIDSIRWVAVVMGFPVLMGNTTPLTVCYPSSALPAGTYTMRLRVYGGGTADSASTSITINPAPKPGTITKTGHVLSIAGATTYTKYQWYNTTGAISGATTKSYTYPAGGTYTIVVDSAGCKGSANIVVSTVGVDPLNAAGIVYSVIQTDNNTILLRASETIKESLHVAIYDMTGKKIANETWTMGNTTYQVSGLSVPAGMYTVKLSNDNTSEVLKWMKQ